MPAKTNDQISDVAKVTVKSFYIYFKVFERLYLFSKKAEAICSKDFREFSLGNQHFKTGDVSYHIKKFVKYNLLTRFVMHGDKELRATEWQKALYGKEISDDMYNELSFFVDNFDFSNQKKFRNILHDEQIQEIKNILNLNINNTKKESYLPTKLGKKRRVEKPYSPQLEKISKNEEEKHSSQDVVTIVHDQEAAAPTNNEVSALYRSGQFGFFQPSSFRKKGLSANNAVNQTAQTPKK